MVFNFATSRFKPLASFWRDTSTASCVATTTRSSKPSSATSALSVETLQLRESSNTAAPCAALPCSSLPDHSHTACHEPTSDQPQATGTTAACDGLSITPYSTESASAFAPPSELTATYPRSHSRFH